MAVKIRSLVTSGPVLVPLSTGRTIRLSPGQLSDEMPDVEVANNAKVEKLQRESLIAVVAADAPEAGTQPAAEPTEQPEETQDEPNDDKSRGRRRSGPAR
jgi:hypothetical protein